MDDTAHIWASKSNDINGQCFTNQTSKSNEIENDIGLYWAFKPNGIKNFYNMIQCPNKVTDGGRPRFARTHRQSFGLLGHTIYKLKCIGPPITVHLMSNATVFLKSQILGQSLFKIFSNIGYQSKPAGLKLRHEGTWCGWCGGHNFKFSNMVVSGGARILIQGGQD